MDDFTKFLMALGPFSAPINVVLGGGLVWLARDRVRILSELTASYADNRVLREKRVEDLQTAAKEYLDHSAATNKVIHEMTSNVRALLDTRRIP